MKIIIKDTNINIEKIKLLLVQKFPEYSFNDFRKNCLMASKSKNIGANVILRKNKVIVEGNFPTVTGRVLFGVSVILLGILIPLVFYLAFFQVKFSKFEKEIGNYLKSEIGII